MLKLLLLFTVVPAVELYLLLQLGAWLGPGPTFLLVLLTGTAGAWLAKREGLGVLRTLLDELHQGIPPGTRLMEGVLLVVGGLLLVTPGVFTDLVGFALIAPPTRRALAPRVLAWLVRRFEIEGEIGTIRHRAPGPEPTPFSNPFDDLP